MSFLFNLLVLLSISQFYTGCTLNSRIQCLQGCDSEESPSSSDPGAPYIPVAVNYSYPFNVVILNQSLSGLTPVIQGSPTTYSITPALPTGLNFNTLTGEITGSTNQQISETDFTITVTDGVSTAQDVVTFRTAVGYLVNDVSDLADVTPGDGICRASNSQCTLRAAIEEANTQGGVTPRVIAIPDGTYTLDGTAALDITSNIEIAGESMESTVIDGGGILNTPNSSERIFNFSVAQPVEFKLSKVTLTKAYPPDTQGGAGIYAATAGGTLVVTDVKMVDMAVTGSAFQHGGGAIQIDGSVQDTTFTISRCEVMNNSATGGSGGGIFVNLNAASSSIKDCKFESNSTTEAGGGVAFRGSSSVVIERSLFVDNQAGANGGGVDSNATSDNITITNSTLYNNSAGGSGGGVYLNSTSFNTILNVTIVNNSANGVAGIMAGQGTIRLQNSILYNNTNTNTATVDNCNTVVADLNGGYNILDSASADCSNLNTSSNIFNTSPMLTPLADHGGLWFTMLPLAGSPVIDAGTNTGCPSDDQRLLTRPSGTSCDIGAVER